MSYLALARHWRPRHFAAMVGQEACLRALTNALDTGRLHHAYLFTGTRGVGKTTLARILAKCLNCEIGISSKPCGACSACQSIDEGRFVDLLEVDAASRTKVEDTRELLDNVQYLPTRGRFKIYLIDEVHMLSGHSFNALLKTLEEPPPHVKFLLATTDPQKLPLTILSRCLQFHLRRVPFDQIVTHLKMIVCHENAQFEEEALRILARAADGSLRDALSLLDQALAYGNGHLETNIVREMLGLSRPQQLLVLLKAVMMGNSTQVLSEIKALAEHAPDFSAVLTELLTLIHNIAIAQQVPEALDDSVEERETILELAKEISPEEIQLVYQIGLTGQKDLPFAPQPKLGFEMVLLRMVAFRPVGVGKIPSNPLILKSPLAPLFQSGETPGIDEIQDKVNWPLVISKLNLTGLVKELAENCTIAEWTPNVIQLVLNEQQKPLLNKRNELRLNEALNQYLGKSMGLRITVGKGSEETPADQSQRLQSENQESARKTITDDPNVQQLVKAFDAKIEHISLIEE